MWPVRPIIPLDNWAFCCHPVSSSRDLRTCSKEPILEQLLCQSFSILWRRNSEAVLLIKNAATMSPIVILPLVQQCLLADPGSA